MARDEFAARELAALEERGLRRRMRAVDGAQGRLVRVDGKPVVNFSANDYLGLASHPALARAAEVACATGTGAGASRLIVGNLEGHRALEQALARAFDRPAALLFNSGYHANVGVLQALVGRGDVVFSDALNHASIIDGCRLSRARVVVYPHRDVSALARGLRECPGRRRVIVSDSVFSMDGDVAPVADLAELAREHEALLVVDEAHAVGALGRGGRGIAAEAGVAPDVTVGTLGKAYGSFGAFALAAEAVVELLVNRARSFVFTTALPPAVTGAGLAAVELASGAEGDQLRAELTNNIRVLRAGLAGLGLAPQHTENTAIFPILTDHEAGAMDCAERLLAAGFYAQGIRPPTVPPGTSRLRVALSAAHTAEDVDGLLQALAALAAEGRLRANDL